MWLCAHCDLGQWQMKVNSLRLEGKAIQCAFPFQFYFNNRKRLLHHEKTKPGVGIDEIRGFRPHLQHHRRSWKTMQIPLPPPRRSCLWFSWVFCIHNGLKNFERIQIQLCKAVIVGSWQQSIRNLFYINRGPQGQLIGQKLWKSSRT